LGVGVLSAILGVGGGFLLIPAMIYTLGMPTQVVPGTSLLQIIFVAANVTFLQAYTNRTVDAVLTLVLLVGGVFGAQFGTRFGATEGRGDIIAVVRGPEREMKVWRKGKVAGIWVNAESVTFSNAPSFYALATSRPLDEVVAPGPAALYRIGTSNLKLQAKPPATPEEAARFGAALIAEQQRDGLFPTNIGKIAFLGERLFRATIAFPANVPTGTYIVE